MTNNNSNGRWPFEVKFQRTARTYGPRAVVTFVRFSVDENAAWDDARRVAKAESFYAVVSVRQMTSAEAAAQGIQL